ncbi:mediator of RNA polymerase II transcription subunit 15a isoform X2 [Rosa rugosa]|uniref:mediator of RNA polymerase II transcription subunit 15a isoform X2 n=1 Tax=Rosa rugosa TaxID=74645 RepID=UPI002B414136|nr:mediator of RNA polymerase II transcription subunit 15a isoform X2 [Rosa rugosa]
MDTNNWRPSQGGEPAMDAGDWRSQLQQDSRQRIVNKIMDTLKRHLPFSGQEGLHELKKIAVRFEEKIYTAATSQSDYLRKISLKMLTMETKSQNPIGTSVQSNSAGNSNRPPDPGSFMQPQVPNQGQSLPMSVPANQSQPRQQLLSQNIQNNIPPNSAGLSSALSPASGLTQTPVPSIVGNANLQSMSGTSQNSLGNSIGQGVTSNMFANSQRQMPGRQQVVQQQQQQQPQNSQQYMYQQQLQQQLMKPKFPQQGNIQLVQNHMQQQQQQQNLLQPPQLQSSQQSVMQPPAVQSSLSGLQQNQQSAMQHSSQAMLQQHPQSVLRQQQQQQQQPQQSSVVHQQQTPIPQQSILPPQQQQQQPQLMVQQPNSTNLPQNQLIGQQNNVGDMQQQQQQRLLSQQNNLLNLQQQQQQQQQQHQLMAQQNNLSNMHQQQLGPQSNVTGLQQQQHLGTQTGNSSMQTNQHSAHMLQSKVQQQHQSSALPIQGHQSQPQASQQQLLSQIQSQPAQIQQQMGMQQQSNPLQRDMQQRIQASGQVSGSMLQPPNVMDQQKQLYQAQRALPETSSNSTAQTGHTNGADWQEEVYQKIKVMKDMYYPELSEMYQKIATKLHQHDSLPQQPKSDQLEKLKMFKTMLERLITVLQISKTNISPGLKEKLGLYEKQIINFINTNRPRKPVSSLPPGQLPPPHMQSMQQSQSQITQVQSHENQMNPQLQSLNLQGSVTTMQQNNMTGMQQNSMSSLSGVSTAQQNMMNPLQPSSNMDPGQGTALNSLQQVPVGSIQQTPVSAPQQANMNALSSQNGINMLQSNINPLQSNSGMLHSQHLKQQEQQLYQNQLKQQQFQQRQMQQQQLMQKQQIIQQQQQQQQQQLQQQAKQQLPGQLQAHQMPQLHQISDVNDVKIRPGMGVKPGAFQQHMPAGQRAYPHSQLKPGSPYPITSSNQLLQAQSPQLSQHSSPQVDQPLLVPKAQNASSPFVIPSPSTPIAPSPMPGDSEKPSSLTNAGNVGHQQTTAVGAQVQSLAIGTPGISASPLLAEFIGPDGTHANALSAISGKSSVTEQPLERLIKAVKSISPKALSASVSDIGSVVSMIDRIAGSAPGNGSRAAVGEDLVAMTKCRLQARNFITHDGTTNGTRKMRRYTSAMPLNVVSSGGSMNDSFKQLTCSETSDLESTATSRIKRPRIEANHALMEEIREINRRLIDTVVDISDEDVDPSAAAAEGGEGTIVKCSFDAVALSPNLKSQYASAQMSPIQPLRLLVPTNYPNCSPILLDKFPVEVSKEYEDLSVKAKSRFSISLRSISQPMSLGEIARAWDNCARTVISEHAQRSGGGSFSSKYGTWENCLSAA